MSQWLAILSLWASGLLSLLHLFLASMGLDGFKGLAPSMLSRRVEAHRTSTYRELYEWLTIGALLDDPPGGWRHDWERANVEHF